MAVVWKKLAFEDDVVLEADFAATSFLYATSDDTPEPKTPAEVMAILSGEAGAEFLFNTQKIGGVVDPTTDQQAATKKYVDDQVLTVNTFLELTDTPADYTGDGLKILRVNVTPDGVEFVAQSGLKLDDFGTADDNTDLDATITEHGLLKKLDNDATHFLNGQGGWAVPAGALDTSGTPEALDFARFTDVDTVEGRSYAEVLADLSLEIGTDVLAQQTIGILDDNLVEIDGADIASGEIARFTANGLESRTPAEVAASMALDDVGVPDAPVDFDLQEATDLVVMKVADAATRGALAAAATEVGQLVWQTDTGEIYACVTSEA